MSDPIEVLLQFAFLGVLYLFLLWVARSALRDLGRPATEPSGLGATRSSTRGARAVLGPAGRRSEAAACERERRSSIGPGLAIGRAPACEITIDDSYASGRHARLYDRDGHVYVEDMNSTNGTYVNGTARRAAAAAAARTTRIRIGDTESAGYEQWPVSEPC